MFFTSALVAGGLAAGGSIGSTFLSNYLGRSNAARAAADQYRYWKKSMLNGPSYQVRGLRSANLNPLLATGLGAGGTNIPVVAPQPQSDNLGDAVGSGLASAIQSQSYKQIKADTKIKDIERDMLDVELDATRAECSARKAQAYVDEIEANAVEAAITGRRPIVRSNDELSPLETPQFDRLVKKLENQIEYDSYMRSKNHAIFEDGINAIHGINQGASAYENWKAARRSYNSSSRYYRR